MFFFRVANTKSFVDGYNEEIIKACKHAEVFESCKIEKGEKAFIVENTLKALRRFDCWRVKWLFLLLTGFVFLLIDLQMSIGIVETRNIPIKGRYLLWHSGI